MSLFTYETHAENPPETWRSVRSGRTWRLTTADGTVLAYECRTRAATDELRQTGFYVDQYEKERRWYAGENVPGWKPSPYAKVPDDL